MTERTRAAAVIAAAAGAAPAAGRAAPGAGTTDGVSLVLPPAALEAIAERVVRMLGAQHEQQHEQSPWLNLDEAAEYLRCSKHRIYRLKSMGKVPYHKEGARLLFHRNELAAWVRAGGAK